MSDYNEKIIAGIKRAMKESRTSMKSLSADSGIPYRSIQNYLAGTARMPADVYVKILEILDVDNQYIMESNFHLKYWPLWDSLWASLGDSLACTDYKPDTGFPDNMELHNKKQVAATSLIQRISDNYNTYRIKSLKEFGDYTPTYPEIFEQEMRKRGGSQ